MKSSETKGRRTQAQRRAETRTQLLDTARDMFLKNGYDQTGMPELVKKAGLTRGALYHHFDDKADLFKAVAERESAAIAVTIDDATKGIDNPSEAMAAGTDAYFRAMEVPGRALILLALAPAVLGAREAKKLIASGGDEELAQGLASAMPGLKRHEVAALTDVLSAAFDRAALEIAQGADKAAYESALSTILAKLLSGAK